MNLGKIKNLRFYRRHRKKCIRYFRWGIKAVFLLLFTVPVAYLARSQQLSVSSLFFVKPTGQISGFTSIESFFMVPITQSPCSTWLSYYGSVNPGLWTHSVDCRFCCPVRLGICFLFQQLLRFSSSSF